MIATSARAPQMSLQDTEGNALSLADHLGKDNVLVYFMRTVTCPPCNAHVKDLVRRREELSGHGVSVVIAVPDTRAEAAAWKTAKAIPFPVVVGTAGTPHEAAGLSVKVFGAMQQSGSMLIDREGTVVHAHAATVPVGAYDRKGIDAALAGLRP